MGIFVTIVRYLQRTLRRHNYGPVRRGQPCWRYARADLVRVLFGCICGGLQRRSRHSGDEALGMAQIGGSRGQQAYRLKRPQTSRTGQGWRDLRRWGGPSESLRSAESPGRCFDRQPSSHVRRAEGGEHRLGRPASTVIGVNGPHLRLGASCDARLSPLAVLHSPFSYGSFARHSADLAS